MYPKECRQRHITYSGRLFVTIEYCHDGQVIDRFNRMAGQLPIMVRSKVCNVHKLSPKEMVKKGEEPNDLGGYFIVRGNERLLRLLIMPRRNYPMALVRPSWKSRGATYTEYGITIHCVGKDQIGQNHILHYLDNGSANLCFAHQKEIFFVPAIMILKALVDMPDYEIFKCLMRHRENNSFMEGCVKFMLRQLQTEKIFTRNDVLAYIGSRFRVKLNLPDWYTDIECANYLIKYSLFTHLNKNSDKFNALIFMLRKLYTLVHQNGCKPDDPDSPMMQEILLPGHLYLGVLAERLQQLLVSMKTIIQTIDAKKRYPEGQRLNVIEACKRESPITQSMEYFLSTGNLVSKNGLGILQSSGFCIIADKLNYMRYLSHFRSVHRGAVFTEIRTTSVRKLTPESWGFLCPVHTPDGGLCGLLNHLSFMCEICTEEPDTSQLVDVLTTLGMIPLETGIFQHKQSIKESKKKSYFYDILLNGKVLGYVSSDNIDDLCLKLRYLKALISRSPQTDANNNENISKKTLALSKGIPKYLEICHIPKISLDNCNYSLYPGLFLFTTSGRMMRPVKSLNTNDIEYIGTMEQCYLHVCIKPEEFVEGVSWFSALFYYFNPFVMNRVKLFFF
jgi:DNA-directed RNA polymerase I subunit RPA2